MASRVFVARSPLPAPAAEVFAWHERPGALVRLLPPWQRVELVERSGGIADGGRTVLRIRLGPLTRRWVAVHRDYQAGRQFVDEQVEGPFARFVHTHRVEPAGPDAAVLEDRVEYALPGGALGQRVGGRLADAALRRLFAYRHALLRLDLERHRAEGPGRALHVAVTGASGLVGQRLCAFLSTGGHRVTRLVRRPPEAPGEVRWGGAPDPPALAPLEGVDAVVHLAGENVAARWTPAQKDRIRRSRVEGTLALAEALARLARPPAVLVSASAIGFYGNRGDEVLDEESPAGRGFLAEVCREWEAAVAPVAARGVRTVLARLGVVLSPAGGALAPLLTPFRLGVGGRIGSGRQFMSWVALDDVIGALHFALGARDLAGPVNVVAPAPVTNAEFARALGRVLGRPAVAPLPALAVRLAFGEMGEELLLASQRVQPRRLGAAGFTFRHPALEGALRFELGRS